MAKILTLIGILLAAVVLWLLLGPYIPDISNIADLIGPLQDWAFARPVVSLLAFTLLYAAVTGLSLPFAIPLSLVAGGVFGLGLGTLAVSFGSTAGATLAFLASRYLFRDKVAGAQGNRLARIEEGLSRDGWLYLFTLRLIPIVPFFAVNLLMGLMKMPVWQFWVTSQIGMLPATLAYVNAGTQVARIDSASDILSLPLLGALALLGLLPWIARLVIGAIRNRRLYADWTRPTKFDRNVIVIGAGSAGLVATYMARTLKAEVTLVEADKMGGDCLNTGCVPSKALIHFARLAAEAKRARDIGLTVTGTPDLKAIMAALRQSIATIEPNDSVERYQGMGAEVLKGRARLIDPWTVEISGTGAPIRRTARSIVLATGAAPFVPDLPGLEPGAYQTSETIWDALDGMETLPQTIAIVGGGPIGCEMAQAFARLGARVTLLQRGPRLLPQDEADAAALAETALSRDGVDIRLGEEFQGLNGKVVRSSGGDFRAEMVIIATGRAARLKGYGLSDLGIATGKTILVDEYLQTTLPNIFAAGDCASETQFTHAAGHQATTAALNALTRGFWRFRYSGRVMPRVTFTDPEVASVGLTTEAAAKAATEVDVTNFELAELDRAVTEGVREGFIRILTAKGKDRILGATIVGPRAGEMIAEFALAMQAGLGLGKILRTVHAYPTWSDGLKLAAGKHARMRAPGRALKLLERFNRWRRG